MKEQIDEFFAYCKKYRKDTQDDWDYIMNWIERLTSKNPETAKYVVRKLSDLLCFHGHHFSPDDLEAFAKANWCIMLKEVFA